MLIDIRTSELANDTNNSIPLSIIIAIYLNYILFKLLPYDIAILNNNNYINYLLFGNRLNASSYHSSNYEVSVNADNGLNNILFVNSKIWDGNMATESNHITNIGNILYTNYNMWLVLSGLILLLAMVGAIVIVGKNSGLPSNPAAHAYPRNIQQQQQRRYSTSRKVNLNPSFVSGLTDGDGSFIISVFNNKDYKIGWCVKAIFKIGLHEKDKVLLEQIKDYFDGGNLSKDKSAIIYRVESLENLTRVINHFDTYPLITQKLADYKLFKQAFTLILNKEHLTMEGLRKIISIKASMNNGLSEELKAAFPTVVPVQRPSNVLEDCQIKDPHWLVGFIEAEGCFYVKISKNSNYNTGFNVTLMLQITLHGRDEQVMRSLVEYLDCGNLKRYGDIVYFKLAKFSDLNEKLIPLIKRIPLQGAKSKDFTDFSKVADLMKNKAHLTQEGLEEIRTIKSRMNTGRGRS